MEPEVEQRETIKLLAELIESQMDLKNGVVAIYNQQRRIPPTEGLFVDVAFLGQKTYGATTRAVNDPAEPDLVEVQTVSAAEVYQIDIFSADSSARLRKNDLIFALSGVAAQQLQEKWSCKISPVPNSFVDVSELEGAARLNRYALTITVIRAYSKARRSPTFVTFQNPPTAILVNP